MSTSARNATRILRHASHCHNQVFTQRSITLTSRQSIIQSRQECHIRQFSLPRYSNSEISSSSNSAKGPGSGSHVIEKPPTTIQPPEFAPISPLDVHESEHMRSIEQAIAELNPGTLPSSQTSLAGDSMHADGSLPPPPLGSGTDAGSQPKKKPSRFWFYLYHILYWSALGSLPVHLLLLKGETKDTKEKQEWKIAVLTDMRDKLKRGESIEEEEALLSVGMDRSKREEQVDDKYFEDLLKSAEKQDFYFGKDKDIGTAFDQNISLPTPAPASAPAPSTVPRKPAPPKSERSYL